MELADTLHNVTVQTPDATSVLADALTKAVVALGRAGEPEQASRIAARAYADIRAAAPAAAQQLNNALHGLAKMPDMPARPTTPTSK